MRLNLPRIARWIGELSLVWLFAATASAAFLPRGVGLDAQDQAALLNPSLLSGLAVLVLGLAACAALWWLLRRNLLNQLALAACAVLALALVLPGGLTLYFLPPPVGLLVSAFLLSRFGDDAASS